MGNVISQVRSIISTTPGRWTQLTQALPEDVLLTRPAEGEWSALECLEHIIDVEKLIHSRLQAFLEGRDLPAFYPDTEGSQGTSASPAGLAVQFENLRAAGLVVLDKLTPEDLLRTAKHAELGPVTLEQMLHEWAAHDLNHTMQAERALMQPHIHGCGPWRVYFESLVIE